jgi:hypothetical protein
MFCIYIHIHTCRHTYILHAYIQVMRLLCLTSLVFDGVKRQESLSHELTQVCNSHINVYTCIIYIYIYIYMTESRDRSPYPTSWCSCVNHIHVLMPMYIHVVYVYMIWCVCKYIYRHKLCTALKLSSPLKHLRNAICGRNASMLLIYIMYTDMYIYIYIHKYTHIHHRYTALKLSSPLKHLRNAVCGRKRPKELQGSPLLRLLRAKSLRDLLLARYVIVYNDNGVYTMILVHLCYLHGLLLIVCLHTGTRCLWSCVYVCMYRLIFVCSCVYLHIQTHTYIYTFTYVVGMGRCSARTASNHVHM